MTTEKVIFALLAAPTIIAMHAFIGGFFVWLGWNHSHALINMREISYGEAFWLCMLVRALVPQTSVIERSK